MSALRDASELTACFVPGVPAPQGSKRHVGHGVMIESSKAAGPWRERIALAAAVAMDGAAPLDGPIELRVRFLLPRPRGHYGSGRNAQRVRPSAPARPSTRPDVDKLLRAVLDALTAVVFRDDSQVCTLEARKEYVLETGDDRPGVQIVWSSPGA